MLQFFALLPIVAPASLLLYSLSAALRKQKSFIGSIHTIQALTLGGIVIALISCFSVFRFGTLETSLYEIEGLGLSLRSDALSMIMFTMITLLGFIIMKFSINYLDGDQRKSVFFARLSATIASVELLVLSGNLAQIFIFWVITSVCLHYLLTFYRNRPQAVAAARKKFMVARVGDISLFMAILFIYVQTGTGNLTAIFNSISSTEVLADNFLLASIFLVIAAVLKSAQFPTHGWLIEVVETPTPVSSLLHAGLLNAGPFLIVRMSFLLSEVPAASMMIIVIGGVTAIFGSIVYLTQPTVKISLGYSSVAHMGFSLLMSGFGVYSAAILHLVAHSFYKAHSFLSSGSVVDKVRAKKVKTPSRNGKLLPTLLSLAFPLLVYAGFCLLWGVSFENDPGLFAIGAIIALGLSQLHIQTVDSASTTVALFQSSLLVVLVTGVFFLLEKGSHAILVNEIPTMMTLTFTLQVAIYSVVAAFGVVILIQLLAPAFKETKFGYRLGIHLRNGLYANVLFDRMVGSLKSDKYKWVNLHVKEEDSEVLVSNQTKKSVNA